MNSRHSPTKGVRLMLTYLIPIRNISVGIFCLGICIPWAAFAQASDPHLPGAYRHIENASPRANMIGGGFTVFFSGLSLARGTTILRDKEAGSTERNTAYLLVAVNAVRFVDGIQRMAFEPRGVSDARAYAAGTLAAPRDRLAELYADSRSLRFLRAHSILVTGLCYLVLFGTKRSAYDKFDQVGGFLIGLAAFQYWKATPEEDAARRYFSAAHHFEVRLFADPERFGGLVNVRF